MALFIKGNELSALFESIITSAKENIYIVDPLLSMSKEFYLMLKDASERGVTIEYIYGNSSLDAFEIGTLAEINNLNFHCLPDISSRWYSNGRRLLISSISISEHIEQGGTATGVLIDSITDPGIFRDTHAEINSYIEKVDVIRRDFETELNRLKEAGDKHFVYQGFCSGCGMPVPFNIDKPYCNMCIKDISKVNESGYCHACGEKAYLKKPASLCIKCSER